VGDLKFRPSEKTLKKMILAILLLAPVLACAEKKLDTNPADYPVVVHVQSSRFVDVCGGPQCAWVLHLWVVIDGKKYELSENKTRTDLLRVGDYKAKISLDEHDREYEYQRMIEFRFPDGWTRKFIVVGESE
jgi:hypothetical protein